MKAMELITAKATAPATGASFAALTGNSLTVRNGPKPAVVLAAWQTRQTVGYTKVTSPMLHDGTAGMYGTGPVGTTLFPAMLQTLEPQDTLSIYGTGSATAGDIELYSMLVGYPDLPGVRAKFIHAAELRRRLVSVLGVPNTISTPTSGEYGAAELIGAELDQFKANTEYAILGATFQSAGHAARWLGPDFGGLGVGMPARTFLERPDWFFRLAQETGLPLIPVFSSANKSLTYIDGVTDENGVDIVMTTFYGRLAP